MFSPTCAIQGCQAPDPYNFVGKRQRNEEPIERRTVRYVPRPCLGSRSQVACLAVIGPTFLTPNGTIVGDEARKLLHIV